MNTTQNSYLNQTYYQPLSHSNKSSSLGRDFSHILGHKFGKKCHKT